MNRSKLQKALQNFLDIEAAGGIVLVSAAVLALFCANIPIIAEWYAQLLRIPVELRLGALKLEKNVLLVINDGLMAVFFLLVALEIKREILEGELSTTSQLFLPGFAAIGGVAVPAAIFASLNAADAVALRGWAIPAATDIAFSLAVLSLLGPRVPTALKVFLTAVAVVDDLVAIVIIAVFYTGQLSYSALLIASIGAVLLFSLNRLNVSRLAAYLLIGLIMWVAVLKSGIHATLAGVVVGFAIPHRLPGRESSLLQDLEHALHPWVAFLILPLFAFANSGIGFGDVTLAAIIGGVPAGIALGLLIGKPIGITVGALVAVGSGLTRLPQGITWSMISGVGLLCGIGFTMSLFVGMLAYDGQNAGYAVSVRVGVFGGSLLAAAIGFAVLAKALRPSPHMPRHEN